MLSTGRGRAGGLQAVEGDAGRRGLLKVEGLFATEVMIGLKDFTE